jgi:TonB family protein
MKELLSSLLIGSLAQSLCYGQNEKIKYYKNDDSGTDSTKCFYYKKGKYTLSWIDSVKGYYCKTGIRRSVEFYTRKGREGDCYYFDINGVLMKKIYFENGQPSGPEVYYYLNGKPKEALIKSDSNKITPVRNRFLVLDAWDSLGNQTVRNYEGHYKNNKEEGQIRNGLRDSIWITYNPANEKVLIEKYNQGKFIEGDRLGYDRIIHYSEYEVSASPKEGLENLYRKIGKNLRYPTDARKKRIQGKVFVKFIIEPDGSISNVEAVRGVYASIDEEAIRVIKLCGPWNPGYQRGLAVRQAFTLPLNFKLN